jgi:ketosteroid isomerase-like protein
MMPDPPDVNLFTRYVLENPYPLAGLMVIAAFVAGWIGLRDGRRNLLATAGAGVLIAGIVFMIGTIVITPAERGEQVTRQLVDRVVAGDINGVMLLFAPDATFAVGSPQNPGVDVNGIRRQAEWLDGRYTITSNRITSLKGYSESSSRAVVHLHCRTEGGGRGPVPTQWVLWIDEQPDGQWRISRITMVSMFGQTPTIPIR